MLLTEKHWSKIRAKSQVDSSRSYNGVPCTTCTLGLDVKGYPRIKIFGRSYKISRIVLGVDLEDASIFACHHCDNPGCIEISHLFVGNARENVQDCIEKGRYSNNDWGWHLGRRENVAH